MQEKLKRQKKFDLKNSKKIKLSIFHIYSMKYFSKSAYLKTVLNVFKELDNFISMRSPFQNSAAACRKYLFPKGLCQSDSLLIDDLRMNASVKTPVLNSYLKDITIGVFRQHNSK